MSSAEASEAAPAESRPGRFGGIRARVRSWPGGRLLWRVLVTIVGTLVTVIGVILLPLPGPGWLIIFGGLGILSTEYTWAARLLAWVREVARRWVTWAGERPLWLRIGLVLLGIVIVAAAVYAVYFYER